MFWVGRLGDDPEALLRVVDEGDGFLTQGGDGPVLAEEVQGAVGVQPALVVQRRRGLGPGGCGATCLGEVLLDVVGDGGPGAVEVQTTGQFVGQEGEIERLAVGEDVGQEVVGRRRPRGVVIAAGRLGCEAGFIGQPLMTQFIEPGAADHQALGRGGGIQLTGVEGGEDLLDVERRGPPGELLLFI
ncbi:MAG: hypothetical protein IH623_05010 [Verrucomicrobia bacterium]|nr:hypothetical protein [Verrucomicrobiota bacterium]